MTRNKLLRPHNTDGIVNYLTLASQGSMSSPRTAGFVISPKVYARKLNPTYQTFCTMTTPATETKSIGLPADAHAVMVFATPP
jgi:hypothetical protein